METSWSFASAPQLFLGLEKSLARMSGQMSLEDVDGWDLQIRPAGSVALAQHT